MMKQEHSHFSSKESPSPQDLKDMGTVAAKVAAVVVRQQGTRLRVEDAAELAESFAVHLKSFTIGLDVSSDQISSL
ncbi:hypothetical protein LOK49_LG01G01784 [Camellia lanceoleosa]|uniref:Uncharacterized protein n=1 Tax=Camellia lanceoleosa TaxID=1840588 RepID=A0ACC0IX86_9ERIC|nr:hypothetical protein LOK49_LG01G01784 [Camellia lanceoleosa]